LLDFSPVVLYSDYSTHGKIKYKTNLAGFDI